MLIVLVMKLNGDRTGDRTPANSAFLFLTFMY